MVDTDPSHGESSGGSISSTLLDRVRARDPLAWERLVFVFKPLVISWCRQMGLKADAEDVAQEVFLAVSNGIESFRRVQVGDTFVGWLRVIARNKLQDYFRLCRTKHPARGVGGSSAQQDIQSLPDPLLEWPDSDEVRIKEYQLIVRKACDLVKVEFRDPTWPAFWETTVNGRSATDVARELGMTVPAVRNAKYKVVRRLREVLGSDLDPPSFLSVRVTNRSSTHE